MAFGKGQQSKEGGDIKRYTGVASVFVKSINPTKEELEKFFEREMDNTPEYVSTIDMQGENVQQVRIDFLVEANPEKYTDRAGNPVNLKTRLSFFLRKIYRTSREGKVQVIDKYGRTAWATSEEVRNKQIPMYSNGKPANLDADYRPAYSGEEDLVKFLIAYLGIPNCQTYNRDTKEWSMLPADKLPDCEARLAEVEKYFTGDISEIKEIIGYQPNNQVKVLFGVRTAEDGRQYQTFYNRMFLKDSVTKNNSDGYLKLAQDVEDTKSRGAMGSTEFIIDDLQEYVIVPTNFNTMDNSEDVTPWGN